MNVSQTVTGPKVNWFIHSTALLKPPEEAKDANAADCIARTAAQLALQEISLDVYLDRMLAHLRKNGPRHLPWDERPREVWPEDDLAPYHLVDLVGGVVKGIMWGLGFEGLDRDEWTSLRTLAKIVWTSPTVEDFTSQTTSTPTPLSLTSLPAAAHDILVAIAYARRHTPLFLYLVSTLPPPPTPCFSLFDWKTIDLRIGDHFTNTYQHSPKHPSNVETEARYWAAILQHGWIGEPQEESLEQWLMELAHQVTNPNTPDPQQAWAMDISSPAADNLQTLLAARGRTPSLALLGHFLSHCPDLPHAQRYFTRFPGSRIAASPGFFPSSTGNLLVPLIESPHLDDDPSLRADLVRLVLETVPGLEVNAHVDRPGSEMRGYGRPPAAGEDFAALHAAAWRGDVGVGRVLVEYGARVGERERVGGLDAAAVARGRGFGEFAEWAEGVAGSG